MRRGPPTIFVQERTYKRRRMAAAARMLPILGVILFMIPLLWSDGETGSDSTRTASVMIYLFVVWAALTGVAAVLSRRLGPEEDTPEDSATEEDAG